MPKFNIHLNYEVCTNVYVDADNEEIALHKAMEKAVYNYVDKDDIKNIFSEVEEL